MRETCVLQCKKTAKAEEVFMVDINRIPPEELGKGSSIHLDVCDTEQDLYWKMAMDVLSVIEENNKAGKDTLMIVPYGPIGPYSRMVELIKQKKILKI